MARKKKIEQELLFNGNPLTYLKLLALSFINPVYFINQTTRKTNLQGAIFYLLITTVLGSLFKYLTEIIVTKNISLAFLGISETLFIVLFAAIITLFFSITLFIFAKILGGKGSFVLSMQAIIYSSSPVILFWIPIIRPIIFIYVLILLILSFRKVHSYSFNQALITIAFPGIAVTMLFFIIGLFDLTFVLQSLSLLWDKIH